MSGKTRKSFAKRFKITGTGKVLRRKAGHRHILRTKSTKRCRKMGQDQGLGRGHARQVLEGLPFH